MVFLKGLVFLLLIVSSIFLILIVMVQRGKGGGLAGALGGMGGQSALGTKAGDLFTRITIGVAAVWIITSMIALKLFTVGGGVISEQMGADQVLPPPAATSPATPGQATPEKALAAPSTPAPAEQPAPAH